jgi:hypothetical protein
MRWQEVLLALAVLLKEVGDLIEHVAHLLH